jgi:hypothetical protein
VVAVARSFSVLFKQPIHIIALVFWEEAICDEKNHIFITCLPDPSNTMDSAADFIAFADVGAVVLLERPLGPGDLPGVAFRPERTCRCSASTWSAKSPTGFDKEQMPRRVVMKKSRRCLIRRRFTLIIRVAQAFVLVVRLVAFEQGQKLL